jgi:hypothetical protein
MEIQADLCNVNSAINKCAVSNGMSDVVMGVGVGYSVGILSYSCIIIPFS